MTAPQIWIPYCGAAPLPAELLARWNFDPLLLAGLGLAAFLYVRPTTRRHPSESWGLPSAQGRRQGTGMPAFAGMTGKGKRGDAAFLAAFALLLLLFVSPFCALSSALFSARVTHHALLAVGVAPLLALAFPVRVRGSLGFWTGAQTVIFWLWHAPPVYGWALSSDPAYWLMQLTLGGSAFGFWAAVRRSSAPVAVAALLATMVQMGLLGALITFAGVALYAPHLAATLAWGLTPLEDQQLAGIIMWAPASAAYLLAAMLLLGRYLSRGGAPAEAR